MSLVRIAKIVSDVLTGLANDTAIGDQYQTALAIAGLAVVVFIVSMYVPNIIQGMIQGASVTGGMESIRHGSQTASFAAGGAALAWGGTRAGASAYSAARASGASHGGAALAGLRGMASAGGAVASAARDKAIGAPGAYAGSLLGLANAKLDQPESKSGPATIPPPKHDI